MIDFLVGTLVEVDEESMVLQVGGVGYRVQCGARHLAQLPPPGHEVRVVTQLVHREDEMSLLGFVTPEDRRMFRMLSGVAGVGNKVALGLLGLLAPAEIVRAVLEDDPRALARAPKVGPKLAQRLVVELKSKVSGLPVVLPEALPAPVEAWRRTLEDALIGLDVPLQDARAAVAALEGDPGFDEGFRRAMRVVQGLRP
ncbi:MAG: Holliday junction branch migration protein RuvA [Candidatus Sericytochromatia bacterium]|nr:Holliday junction branch migration protein RuvA [Candidatus Sericytochromatia bacterium]